MSTRTAYPATESTGDVLSTTNFDKLPGGWIGHLQITSYAGGTFTSAALVTGLSVSVTVNTSRRIKITGYASVYSNQNNDYVQGQIVETTSGSTVLAKFFQTTGSAVASQEQALMPVAIVTPSAGSHTYELWVGHAGTSAGTETINPTSTNPAFILVEDIGPA